MKKLSKKQMTAWLARRFFLRIHMFVILGGTYVAGAVATKILYNLGVDTLWLRYALAVCGAYLVFLLLIRMWLWYVGFRADREDDRSGPDFDLDPDAIDFCGELASSLNPLRVAGSGGLDPVPASGGGAFGGGGGGSSGGGGATGSWGIADVNSSSGSSTNLPSVDLDLDLDGVLILALIVVLSLAVAAFYLIWAAPAILGEAAFEAALAVVLARRAKKIDRAGAGWVGSVARATIWPFIAILVLSIGLGWYAQKQCPDARRLTEVFACEPR